MSSPKENVLEAYARYTAPGAMLYINTDSSWSIGTTTTSLAKVTAAGVGSVADDTFGWSAMATESDGQGGWRLYARNDEDEDMIAQVAVDKGGQINLGSVSLLSAAQMYALEERLGFDLNASGGLGIGPVLLQGGSANLYMNELGSYQVGDGASSARSLTLGGQPLDDQLLPQGWEIAEVVPQGSAGSGWLVYAQSPAGDIFEARFAASGEYTGGAVVAADALDALEREQGVDIDGDQDLPAPEGWTSILQDAQIRAAVEQALEPPKAQALSNDGRVAALDTGPAGTVTYTELVTIFQTVIKSHRDAGDTPVTAQEMAALQAMAARGRAVFAGDGAAADYLTYVLGKIAEGSPANRFFNGGSPQASELGSLGAGSSIDVLDRLVQKWLLGADMPSTATAGDSATGAARSASPTYAKSAGTLFVDGISVSDVKQGSMGDCYLLAVAGGLAGTRPTAIQALFIENPAIDGVRSWGVRLFDSNGRSHWVTVNDMLPTSDGSTLAYGGSPNKDLNGEIWVPLLEKAYAQANTLGILPRGERSGLNTFAAIEGGWGDPLAEFLGSKVTAIAPTPVNYGNPYIETLSVNYADAAARAALESLLVTHMNAGKMIFIGDLGQTITDSFGNQMLVKGHAHFAIDADPANPSNRDVKIYNPWGLQDLPDPPANVNFLSPVTSTVAQLIELVGTAGLHFQLLDAPGG